MTAISSTAKKKISEQIHSAVEAYLNASSNAPLANSGNPFVMALLKDFDPLLHRIHGLKTSLGNQMEKISEIIAVEVWGKENVSRHQKVKVSLPLNVVNEINLIITSLRNIECHPNYQNEKERVINACLNPSSDTNIQSLEFDLFLYDRLKKSHYCIELKGPEINTGEASIAKSKLLTAMAFLYMKYKSKSIDSIIGIYYNNKFPKPYKNSKILNYFDPAYDMKVHTDYWNFIGKNPSTFSELLGIFEIYGKKNKKRIWDGFSKLILEQNVPN